MRFALLRASYSGGKQIPDEVTVYRLYKTPNGAREGLDYASQNLKVRNLVLVPLPLTAKEAYARCGPNAGIYEIADTPTGDPA
jgi:hypothetical protein